MALTYTAIATTTVGSGGASSIDFTVIPQTYTDLVVKTSTQGSANVYFLIRFNSNTSNRSGKYLLYQNGTSVSTGDYEPWGYGWVGSGEPQVFGSGEFYIPNYTSSNFKSISSESLYESNAVNPRGTLMAGLWSNTSAITSVNLVPASGTFAQYTTATLYGIKNTV